jgi:hypothetical protein
MQAARPHRFDVSGPLVDEHDIEPGIGEIGGDATPFAPVPRTAIFFFHHVPKWPSRR